MNVPIVFPIFSNYHGFEHRNTYGLQMLIANYQYVPMMSYNYKCFPMILWKTYIRYFPREWLERTKILVFSKLFPSVFQVFSKCFPSVFQVFSMVFSHGCRLSWRKAAGFSRRSCRRQANMSSVMGPFLGPGIVRVVSKWDLSGLGILGPFVGFHGI